MRLPSEVLRLVVEQLPLSVLAMAASASREALACCRNGLYRKWCCRTCGLPVVHPRHVVQHLSLHAGPFAGGLLATDCEGASLQTSAALQDAELLSVLHHKAGLCFPKCPTNIVPLSCAGCNKHLGEECLLASGEKLKFFHAGGVALHDSLGRIPRRAGSSRSSLPAPLSLRCSGVRRSRGLGVCNAPLASMDEVLSTEHCWRPIAGRLEQAWFVNAVDSAVQVGPARDEQLAQGMMVVADLFCNSCGANVGWKFVADQEADNRFQVGRFGLVLSSLRTMPTTREWQLDTLVAALEQSKSWAALEMEEHPQAKSPRCTTADKKQQNTPGARASSARLTLLQSWSSHVSSAASMISLSQLLHLMHRACAQADVFFRPRQRLR